MKNDMRVKRVIFVNRAPFEHLDLEFFSGHINVLTGINGKGKTTILSYIVDAFHEFARPHFSNSYVGKENKFYRYSSHLFNIHIGKVSFVYIRFEDESNYYDYIDIRGELTETEYEKFVPFKDKITLQAIGQELKENGYLAKVVSSNVTKEVVNRLFNTYVLTYFPSYRYEYPGYLNDPYKFQMRHDQELKFNSELRNPIEVVSDLNELSNWFLDVVLDGLLYSNNVRHLHARDFLNSILATTLSHKLGPSIRFGVGDRNRGASRLSVTKQNGEVLYPSIFNISSGEAALLCIFGEIFRQADVINKDMNVSGIVLIDEIDKHLHISLQKTVLPLLLNMYPQIQFVVTSHSPFMNAGFVDTGIHANIYDLDNNGLLSSPHNTVELNRVYDMVIGDNINYLRLYNELKVEIAKGQKPLVLTEGKTDAKHLQAAAKALHIDNLDIEYFEITDNQWGNSQLQNMLIQLSKIKQNRIIVGIFDRDDSAYIFDGQFKQLGDNSNVYEFTIPFVNNGYGDKISIEHYYKRGDLTKIDNNGRRLFLGDEFFPSSNSKNGKFQTRISQIQNKIKINGIIDEKVYNAKDLEQTNSIALSKNDFADLVLNDENYAKDFDYSDFNRIFDIIKQIVNNGTT